MRNMGLNWKLGDHPCIRAYSFTVEKCSRPSGLAPGDYGSGPGQQDFVSSQLYR